MSSRLLLAALLCPTVLCAAPLPKPEPAESHLELRLLTKTARVKRGEEVRWEATIVNRGKEEVTLVQPGDGSDCGWRTPIIEWVINGSVKGGIQEVLKVGERKKSELQPACLREGSERIARCGNINALKAEEVIVLKPGEQFKFNGWMSGPSLVNQTGTIKVAVRYFHIPDLQWKGLPLGTHDPRALDQIKRSKRVTLESNVFEIVVEE